MYMYMCISEFYTGILLGGDIVNHAILPACIYVASFPMETDATPIPVCYHNLATCNDVKVQS